MIDLITEADAMLRGCLIDPMDDAPRLIYADWLDDHERELPSNAEHAEFIRLQIALADEKDSPWTAQKVGSVMDRVEWLLRSNVAGTWGIRTTGRTYWGHTVSPAHYRAHEAGPTQLYVRGFPDCITLAMNQFEKHAEHLFANHPITDVKLSDRSPFRSFSHHEEEWYWIEEESETLYPIHPLPRDRDMATLPDKLFAIGGLPFTRLQSARAAMNALSDACVSYGRYVAGLPPL